MLTGFFGIPKERNKPIFGSYSAMQAPPNLGPFNYNHMSTSLISGYGQPSRTKGEPDEDRKLLWATAGLAMTKLVGPTSSQASLPGSDEFPWHPFTRSFLDRARQASSVDGRANTAPIERLIHQEILTHGYANLPVIKWQADPFDAFACLSRLGLDELLQLETTRLWRRASITVAVSL